MTTEIVDFIPDELGEMSEFAKGKTVESINVDWEYDSYLIIAFTDKSKIRVRYDYIYDYQLVQ